MWFIKPYKIIRSRMLYKEQEQSQDQIKEPPKRAQSQIKINICLIKDHFKSKDDQYDLDLQEFTILEHKTNKRTILTNQDWHQIISSKSFKGYLQQDIHLSLMLQTMDFSMRRQWWNFLTKDFREIQDQGKGFKQKSLIYNKLKKKSSIHEIQILKDVRRTQIDNFYKKEENLNAMSDILLAIANQDTELGYVQGINIIVANVLICYDMTVNDQQFNDFEIMDNSRNEAVFHIMEHILNKLNWRSIFLEDFVGLKQKLSELEEQIQKKLPDLYQHLLNEGFNDISIIFQRYYMTLLMYQTPWHLSRLVLDLFLFEGEVIIHRLIMAMLQTYKSQLLRKNFKEILDFTRDQMIIEFLTEFEYRNQNQLLKMLNKLKLI